ncbi:hypothetical protein HMPREF2792_01385 [Corynebacterium sp. HMSC068H04]|uniref:glycosyltransferase family 1 protein n=1 Tax=Corynebacterium sp. HMSC068H04 TaxID=1739296 RepID=UPI0008A3D807|nr:glycosyltransferase family 1 protein [Corynebacterium sp. HMSC068H04]OFK93710.1 hypothetical protein HMPREF2792_01385 [Corynebacterium sp. HMSC068H04]
MRISIYDGILETHVASSLERALVARGHSVLNTGKIGHGFKFPTPGQDQTALEVAVRRVIDFDSDVCFVMRPASLPFSLLKKLKKQGITLVAWLSDDPVLFDLSYGPIVDSYDLVLHCGNVKVLEFYEEYFGRPTGVNFPFWTDHEAFPRVWGKAEPLVDLMFLGNVQDEVRRSRYFKLAGLTSSVRVHGNVGADYIGLSGGYLDGNNEVLLSGASTRAALNIPQFFRDHRGLETWFEGLGALGFFEYPSRVIQYMAMGIPTISVVPSDAVFRSYPEMLTASTIHEADEAFRELSASGGLADLSSRVGERFDRNFSAESRVLALEALLESDNWKQLDAAEREVWFTQFDGRSAVAEAAANTPREASEIVLKERNLEDLREQINEVIVLQEDGAAETSRSSVIVELLKRNGIKVNTLAASEETRLLVPDPSRVCDTAVNVGRLLEAFSAQRSVLIVADTSAAITSTGANLLRDNGIKTIGFESGHSSGTKVIARMAEFYDLVITSNRRNYNYMASRGFENVHFLPALIHPDFARLVSEQHRKSSIIKVNKDQSTENVFAPAFTADMPLLAIDKIYHYEELEGATLSELAEYLTSEVALLTHSGTRNNPKISHLVPYILTAADWVFSNRVPDIDQIYPLDVATTLVGNPGELRAKLELLSASDYSVAKSMEKLESGRALIERGNLDFLDMVSLIFEKDVCLPMLKSGDKLEIPLSWTRDVQGSGSVNLKIRERFYIGSGRDWRVRVVVDGKVEWSGSIQELSDLLVQRVNGTTHIRLEAEYLGASRLIPRERAFSAECVADFRRSLILAGSNVPRVLESKN